MENQRIARSTAPLPEVDKWEVMNSLSLAGTALGLSDRTLGVLRVLLSFHPDRNLKDGAPMVVFASNKSLSDRAHGMPESTLRRHIAVLVDAGVIRRHDSPNGKRYARRTRSGDITRAFGFDLRPMLVRAGEFAEMADQELDRRHQIKTLREDITLMMRDAAKLMDYATDQGLCDPWDALSDQALLARRYLRRKLALDDLRRLHIRVSEILAQIEQQLGVQKPVENLPEPETETRELSGKAHQNERHYQSSKKENYDKEPEPVEKVQALCPDIQSYFDQPTHTWDQFIRQTCRVAPMLGISAENWRLACLNMGAENAATVVAVMVQRITEYTNPGAYFHVLAQKAKAGEFSPRPMLAALEKKPLCQAA